MEDQDLLEIGILNSGHRQRILQAIQLLPKVPCGCVLLSRFQHSKEEAFSLFILKIEYHT